MKADERAAANLDKALKKLKENPVALVLMEGDADPGHLLEATDVLVAISCQEAKTLQDRALTKVAKVARKDWARFLTSFRGLALGTSEVLKQRGEE
jgi:hypothetical protein